MNEIENLTARLKGMEKMGLDMAPESALFAASQVSKLAETFDESAKAFALLAERARSVASTIRAKVHNA